MRQKLDKKKKIILTAIASWGILLIGSGSIMQLMIKPVKIEKNLDIKVMQRKVEKTKTNDKRQQIFSQRVCGIKHRRYSEEC